MILLRVDFFDDTEITEHKLETIYNKSVMISEVFKLIEELDYQDVDCFEYTCISLDNIDDDYLTYLNQFEKNLNKSSMFSKYKDKMFLKLSTDYDERAHYILVKSD